VLAEMPIYPGIVIAWSVAGFAAAWLAWLGMKGDGKHLIGAAVPGSIAAAFLGGYGLVILTRNVALSRRV